MKPLTTRKSLTIARAASVLDASALLAYLLGETGAPVVTQAIARTCVIGAANWAEVLSKLADIGQNPDAVTARLTQQGILGAGVLVHEMDERQAREVGRLRPLTRSAGLSLGDRACLALALVLDTPVLTADRSWCALSLGVTVQVIR
jgi:ribonuclease VapC